MEDALWGACDPQPLQQVGTFNGAETLLSGHAESPFPTYWACDEISDINLMSVESLAAFDPMMSLHPAESIPQPQWGSEFYPTVTTQDVPLQEILNNGQFMPGHFNPSPAAAAHVGDYPSYKSFGSVIRTSFGGGGSSSNSSRPYGAGSSSSSSSMFVPPQRIISTDHRNVVVESSRRDCEEPKMTSFNPGPYVATTAATLPTPKPVSLPLPIPNSARQHHRQVSSSPVMNLSGFEPSPRPMSQVSSSPRPMSQVSSSPRPMSHVSGSPGFEPSRPMSQVSSSPVMSMSYGEQRVMSSSPGLTFESRHPKSSSLKPSSSPVPTVVGFEPIPQQHQSSSPSPNMMVGSPQQQRQQQQQPAFSTSPPLSNLSFEPLQPPPPPSMSNSPSTSNLVFEPRRPPPTPSPRPQATTSNINNNNPRSDVVVEPASKWPPLRIVGSEKALFSPQTDTIKYPIPKSTSANYFPAPNALNPVNKRPLSADDNKNNNQGGSMNKKLMQKWQGGCSRLEEISNAAHQKVTQNTSGRALGPALNTNLKPRARQGSANDPQSIAARVRRERISERLKVLQTLIPNGDKVDMVTMLEKAINYVQCLELQIRMLKNDSLWPKALGPLPNTLQELLELAGPEFLGGKDLTEETTTTEKTTSKKLVPAEVIEFDGNQPSADKE